MFWISESQISRNFIEILIGKSWESLYPGSCKSIIHMECISLCFIISLVFIQKGKLDLLYSWVVKSFACWLLTFLTITMPLVSCGYMWGYLDFLGECRYLNWSSEKDCNLKRSHCQLKIPAQGLWSLDSRLVGFVHLFHVLKSLDWSLKLLSVFLPYFQIFSPLADMTVWDLSTFYAVWCHVCIAVIVTSTRCLYIQI